MMLRKFGMVLALAGTIALGGCVTTGGGASPVDRVISGAKLFCNFVPLGSAVEVLLRGGTSITDAISSICAALNTTMQTKRMAPRNGATVTVTVRGVKIPGKIVR